MTTYRELQEKQQEEYNSGEGFIYDMFLTELYNHEYGYTGDPADAIAACGLTVDDINANPALLHGLEKAMLQIHSEQA